MYEHSSDADPYTNSSSGISKPILKWAGGRGKLVAKILLHLRDEGNLIEPFHGAD